MQALLCSEPFFSIGERRRDDFRALHLSKVVQAVIFFNAGFCRKTIVC